MTGPPSRSGQDLLCEAPCRTRIMAATPAASGVRWSRPIRAISLMAFSLLSSCHRLGHVAERKTIRSTRLGPPLPLTYVFLEAGPPS